MEYDEDNLDFLQEGKEMILSLSRNESLFLDDSLTLLVEKDGSGLITTMRPLSPSANAPAPVTLIDKIGMAVLFTTDENNSGKNAEVWVDIEDLYLLREITHSFVKLGSEPVGFNLKRKIYTLLYGETYQRDRTVEKFLREIPLDEKPSRQE